MPLPDRRRSLGARLLARGVRRPRVRVSASALVLGSAVLLAAFLTACAGSNGDSSAGQDVRRVGLMHVGLDHVPKSLDGITDGLAELGWVDGENIELIWRNLDKEAAAQQARVFVFQNVDLIVGQREYS